MVSDDLDSEGFMSTALLSMAESVRRGFPLVFKKVGSNSVLLKYKGKSLIFVVKKLVNIGEGDNIEKIAVDYQGLSTVLAELDKNKGSYKLYPENIPIALRMIEELINPHEADLWHIRLAEYPRAKITKRLDSGFVLKKHEVINDVILEKNGVVAAWINLLTMKTDLCLEEQAESGVYVWGNEDLKYIRQVLSMIDKYIR
jgi:hypothetical protein